MAIPSFWGAITWSMALFTYIFMDIGWYPPHFDSLLALFGMLFCFILSFFCFSPFVKNQFDFHFENIVPKINFYYILVLHLIGLAATALFVSDISNSGYLSDNFFALLLADPLVIRAVPLDGLTRGIFLGYIGWLAVFLSATQVAVYRDRRVLNSILVILQICANILFLSKMRPVVVIMIFIVPFIIMTIRYKFIKLSIIGVMFSIIIFVFFTSWSYVTGKVFELGIGYNPVVETFILYLTSGPAYLSHIMFIEQPEMTLSRTLRPLYVISSILFDTAQPPSRILPFYDLPISTNVGTALEPWFRDLGATGMFLGMIALSFGVDMVAYLGLRFGRLTGLLVVMTMCYCSIFAFFVPRLTTGPVFAVLSLFLLHVVLVVALRLKWSSPR